MRSNTQHHAARNTKKKHVATTIISTIKYKTNNNAQSSSNTLTTHTHTHGRTTQVRLLHREVDLLLQGVDKQGNLYGAVLHPKGDVRHELLKQGLARMVDWSLVYVSRSDALAMRQAENEGKRARLRLWREWAPPQIDGDADYAGVVVEVRERGRTTAPRMYYVQVAVAFASL